MKNHQIVFIILVLTNIFLSCNKGADKNDELNAVIDHYSGDARDSLKLKAAKFLVENLKGAAILDTTTLASQDIYYDLIYNTWKREKMRVGFRHAIQTRVIDSLNKADNLPQIFPNIRMVDDADVITADFLINNIDNAFEVWQNMPWSRHIPFSDFCEYILPYRSTYTYSLDARSFFLKKYKNAKDSLKNHKNPFEIADAINNDISKWFSDDASLTTRYPYLYPTKFSNLLKGKFGDCQATQSVRISALRALGIPAVMDEVIGWGNSNTAHYWLKIIDPLNDTVKTKITNNISVKSPHNILNSSFDAPDYHEYPPNVQVVYGKTVPKVYRGCFSIQSNTLAKIKAPTDEVPPYFLNPRIKDVTDTYFETAEVSLNLDRRVLKQKFVYLCIFDNQNWKPVTWALNDNYMAHFKSMGKNIVYLPAYYKNKTLIPAGAPFLLDEYGKVNKIVSSPHKEKVKLYAKFPTRSYVLEYQHAMVGGRFQLANKSDLSDTVTVNTVKAIPFNKTEIKVTDKRKYRYLVYQFKGIAQAQMSELTFYGLDNKGNEVELSGKLMGSKGSYPYVTERLFDGNRANYFKSAKDDAFTFVAIDLGENKATTITRIAYIPHGDDNNVVSDDTYGLFYWNGEWVPIGVEIAHKNNTVEFNSVPKNALLLLKNLAGGVEERIFTFKKGRQNFW